MNLEGLSIVTCTKYDTHYHHIINDAQTRYFDEPFLKSRGTKNDLTLYGDKNRSQSKGTTLFQHFVPPLFALFLQQQRHLEKIF